MFLSLFIEKNMEKNVIHQPFGCHVEGIHLYQSDWINFGGMVERGFFHLQIKAWKSFFLSKSSGFGKKKRFHYYNLAMGSDETNANEIDFHHK